MFAKRYALSAPSVAASVSAARVERTTRRALFELQEIGEDFPLSSV